MKQTGNYKLNQWEKSDRIMMEDFNADNTKLEAALNAIWETFPLVKLTSQTLSAETTRVNLDLSGVNLNDYRLLRLDIRFPSNNHASYYLALQVNGVTGGYVTSDGKTEETLALIYIDRTMALAKLEIDVGLYLHVVNRTPIETGQVTSLNLTGTNNIGNLNSPTAIPAGSKITLYGLKG